MANLGVISAITDIDYYMQLFYKKPLKSDENIILGDQLNHRSIQMGAKLAKAPYIKYEHNNTEDLEKKLHENKDKNILIVTDGVFSMDGDIAPLDKITQLASAYKAAIMVDDAHGTGVFGKDGKGISEHFNVSDKIDFHMGTLSKAFGGLGGFIAAKKDLIDMLKVNTSTYYFTSSLPADQAASLITSIKIVKSEPQIRKQLWQNVYRFLKGLSRMEVNFPLRFSQIIPIIVNDEKKAFALEEYLYENGVICSAVTVPAVAPNMARIRISVNANHNKEQIDYFLELLDKAIHKFNLPTMKYSEQDWNNFLTNSPDYIIKFIGE